MMAIHLSAEDEVGVILPYAMELLPEATRLATPRAPVSLYISADFGLDRNPRIYPVSKRHKIVIPNVCSLSRVRERTFLTGLISWSQVPVSRASCKRRR